MIKSYKEKSIIIQISPKPNSRFSPEYIDLKKIYNKNGAKCELRLAVEKSFWTELNVFYQEASSMLRETDIALSM